MHLHIVVSNLTSSPRSTKTPSWKELVYSLLLLPLYAPPSKVNFGRELTISEGWRQTNWEDKEELLRAIYRLPLWIQLKEEQGRILNIEKLLFFHHYKFHPNFWIRLFVTEVTLELSVVCYFCQNVKTLGPVETFSLGQKSSSSLKKGLRINKKSKRNGILMIICMSFSTTNQLENV